MKQLELTKTFMMISKLKRSVWSLGLYTDISELQGFICRFVMCGSNFFQRIFFATFILINSYFISGFCAGNNKYV